MNILDLEFTNLFSSLLGKLGFSLWNISHFFKKIGFRDIQPIVYKLGWVILHLLKKTMWLFPWLMTLGTTKKNFSSLEEVLERLVEAALRLLNLQIQRGDPFSWNFFVDLIGFMGIKMTVFISWFQICMIFSCVSTTDCKILEIVSKLGKIKFFVIFDRILPIS